ncbi:hypothetical protein A4X13_0g4521 [Tilletia indica]|uniref:Uncharacterized protein n=1 Tax=Tilletia indica TaxID=43049 RepID=A0A8T8SXX5_9BASI|nr:hypothetical protein A4X13_0g4521 [Tilletia indica]
MLDNIRRPSSSHPHALTSGRTLTTRIKTLKRRSVPIYPRLQRTITSTTRAPSTTQGQHIHAHIQRTQHTHAHIHSKPFQAIPSP